MTSVAVERPLSLRPLVAPAAPARRPSCRGCRRPLGLLGDLQVVRGDDRLPARRVRGQRPDAAAHSRHRRPAVRAVAAQRAAADRGALGRGALHREGGRGRLLPRRDVRVRARGRPRALAAAQRGFLPYIVASQTVPILAIAPMVVDLARRPRAPRLVLGLRDRRLPDLLPGDDQHAARAPVGRPARARAHALVRGEPLANPLEAARSRLAAVPLRRAQGRGHGEHRRRDHRRAARLDPGRPRRRDPQLQPVLRQLAAQPVGDEPDRGAARDHLLPRRSSWPRSSSSAARRSTSHERSASSRSKGVTKQFGKGGVTALQGIDLEIAEREFVSLIGPSGCGKSTLLRIVGDLIQPTARRGRRQRQDARIRRGSTATTGSSSRTPCSSTGARSPRTSRCRSRCSAGTARRRSERVAGAPGAGRARRASRSHHPWQLSGGMQQRVSIARALSFSPAAPAHGRAVRRARRDDPRAPQHRAAADLGGQREHDRLRHALDLRGGLPLDPRRRDVARARAGSPAIVEIDLPQPRTAETREQPRFFELVTEVRDRLRGERRRAVRGRAHRRRGGPVSAGPTAVQPVPRGVFARRVGRGVRDWVAGGRRLRARASPRGRAASAALDVQNFLLPPLSDILRRLLGRPRGPPERRHGSRSRRRVGGFVIGCSAGILVALVARPLARPLASAVMPYAIAANAIPIIAFAPITNNWFGLLSPASKMAIAAVLCFFPVLRQHAQGADVRAAGLDRADAVATRPARWRSSGVSASRTRCRTSSRP